MLLRYRFLLLFALLLPLGLRAQDCQYQLLLQDELGDGWNGGELTVRVADVSTTYTLTEAQGDRAVIFFSVSNGDAVELDFNAGAFPDETSFSVFNNADSLIYQTGPPPATGINIFSFTADCKTCVPPAANGIEIFRVRSTTADIKFNTSSPGTNPRYLIEYGQGDYDPETDGPEEVLSLADTSTRVSNLTPDTLYTFWFSTICQTEDDTTSRRGPYQIMTQKRADVGITELMSPATGCNLSAEAMTIGITNYGGEAQAFFNVDFTINGQASGVSRPADGIFTGVVGVDSTEFFTFDAMAFLDRPGTYTFAVWTELEEDEDTSNDTMTFTVTHVPQITEFPYFENFEEDGGFWYSERGGRGISSWRWGEPFATFIDRAPNGQNAWVTNLGGDYNDREKSFLVSPCFDLSELEEDPLFSAIIRVQTETDFDAAHLEMTTDDGESWQRVRSSPAATGWYNDLANQVWEGDGGVGDRAFQVSNLLEGAAGDTIQLRFVFESSRSTTLEGILVDAVSISERAEQDLAAISATSDALCFGFPPSDYSVTVANLGTQEVNNFTINYLLNDMEGSENIDLSLLPGQQTTVTLNIVVAPVFAPPSIPFWLSLDGDENVSNDTAFLLTPFALEVPFHEDFTNGRLPDRWDLSEGSFSVQPDPATNSIALVSNNDDDRFSTAYYGPFQMGDSLRFRVSLSDLNRPDTASFKASLSVELFECDVAEVLEDIDSLINGEYSIPLEEGRSGIFTFRITTDTSESVISFDNINVLRCPANLGLIADVVGVSTPGGRDAIASVTPTMGLPPFTFSWSTGDNTMSVDGLAEGPVVVTVTDVQGCTDEVEFTVDLSTSLEDPLEVLAGLSVFPNPTKGDLELRLDLPKNTDLQATIYDLTGRELLRQDFGRQRQLRERLDFSQYPAGIYLLRLQAGEAAARTVRVIRR